MTKNKEYQHRTYLDPIHGPIQLSLNNPIERLLVKIIDSKEFQRLRRIHQMGLGWVTFHGAEHSRFGHSIGTLFIAKKMTEHLQKRFQKIREFKAEILVSALIHDIGHGPFSHTSEKLNLIKHEEISRRIIKNNSEISTLLRKYDRSLPEKVIRLLTYSTKYKYLSQLISSFIDCDRLDYLYRDSYYIGVPYGLIGLDRIISSLEIEDNNLVVLESIGLDAVIHYLQARYSMYQQIYQHKKNLACDFMLRKIFQCLKISSKNKIADCLKEWLNLEKKPIDKINLNLYLQADDYALMSCIKQWADCNTRDKVLKDLCSRFINRNLFKSCEFRSDMPKKEIHDILNYLQKTVKRKNLAPGYYLGIEQSSSSPYELYKTSNSKNNKAILIKQNTGVVKEISRISNLVKALSSEKVTKTCLIYAPELENEIYKIKGFKEIFR